MHSTDRKENVKYVVDDSGKRTAVIVPLKEYEELLEDLHDLAVIAERRDESTIPYNDVKKKIWV